MLMVEQKSGQAVLIIGGYKITADLIEKETNSRENWM